MVDDTIIARIRKLMALTADRGATEAEAQLASSHVQRLLAEHNLSMATVEASNQSSGDGGKRVKEGVRSRQVYKWQRDLMAAVAKLNYCKAFAKWQNRGWNKANVFDGYELIGRVDNVATTKVMFEYLQQTIERLAREDVGGDAKQFFTRYAHSFKQGCSDRVTSRLRDEQVRVVKEQERKAREQNIRNQHPGAASTNLPAVMLSDVIQTEIDLNEDFIQGLAPGTTARVRAEFEAKRAAAAAERKAKFDAAIAAGYLYEVAQYISYGYDPERAVELATPVEQAPKKPETDAQRRKRQAREEAESRRYWERQSRRGDKIDRGGYQAGNEAGADISLNRQVDEDRKRRLA